MGRFLYICAFISVTLLHFSCSSKVFELSDRFTEIRKDGAYWLVKFYAPWCGHCKRLEPIWKHVAQALAKTNIRVGKVDCTRFPSITYDFNIYNYPTIKFIKPDGEHTYHGDRTTDALVKYATRMAGPPVQEITRAETLANIKNLNQLFFMYVGESEGPLWDVYVDTATRMQPYGFFYSTSEEIAKPHVNIKNLPAVFVHKEGMHIFYPIDSGNSLEEAEHLNKTLTQWVNEERFDTFPQVTKENINEYLQAKKFLALVIVEQSKIKKVPEDMLEFRDRVESVIRKKRDTYHKYFQFGWVGEPSLAHNIAMEKLPLPYLLVLNSSTFHHHLPEDDPTEMTVEAIEMFLDSIVNSSAPAYGGNTIPVQMYRKYFDLKNHLEGIWEGNPYLALLIFGLPSMFLLLIFYSICCADILDADEEDEDELLEHEKRE